MSWSVDDRVTAVSGRVRRGNRRDMTHETPLSPRPLSHLSDTRPRVLTTRALREHGVSAADASARCRPGGPWQMLLPGVCLLHPGPPTSEDRLRAALLYAARRPPVPSQARPPTGGTSGGTSGEGMITGLAALALHGLACVPPLTALQRIDVLLPRTRRLRSTGCVRIVRGHDLPEPVALAGLPVAPVVRALADTAALLSEELAVRRLLTEAVREGRCEARSVVRELGQAGLLTLPHVRGAVDHLLAEGRAVAEGRLYEMVRDHCLPDPCWNVELSLPGGARLGRVDAYWPDQAVAVELDARPHGERGAPGAEAAPDAMWTRYARRREALERVGITVVHLAPAKLRENGSQQAAVVRTALMAAFDRDEVTRIVVRPR